MRTETIRERSIEFKRELKGVGGGRKLKRELKEGGATSTLS